MHCPIISIYWKGGYDYMAAVNGQDVLDVDVFLVFVHSPKNSLTGIVEPLKEWLERHKELGDAVWQLVQAMYSRKTSGTNFRDLWETRIRDALELEFERGGAEPCLCCSGKFHVLNSKRVDDERSDGRNQCSMDLPGYATISPREYGMAYSYVDRSRFRSDGDWVVMTSKKFPNLAARRRLLAVMAYAVPGARAEVMGVSDAKLMQSMFVITCIAVAIAIGAVIVAYRAMRPQARPLPVRAGGPMGRAQAAGYACSPQIRTAADVALQRQLATADAERIARQAQRDAEHDAWVDAALANTLADTGATGSTVSTIQAELSRSEADARARMAFLATLESSHRETSAARQSLRYRQTATVSDGTQRMLQNEAEFIRREGYCGSCGMWGHWSRDCPQRQRPRRQSEPEAEDEMEIDLVE